MKRHTFNSFYILTYFCLFPGAEFGKGNGIPHRIAPSNSDDSDDSDYKDYDMLHDAEREKDVFRTKVSRIQVKVCKN